MILFTDLKTQGRDRAVHKLTKANNVMVEEPVSEAISHVDFPMLGLGAPVARRGAGVWAQPTGDDDDNDDDNDVETMEAEIARLAAVVAAKRLSRNKSGQQASRPLARLYRQPLRWRRPCRRKQLALPWRGLFPEILLQVRLGKPRPRL